MCERANLPDVISSSPRSSRRLCPAIALVLASMVCVCGCDYFRSSARIDSISRVPHRLAWATIGWFVPATINQFDQGFSLEQRVGRLQDRTFAACVKSYHLRAALERLIFSINSPQRIIAPGYVLQPANVGIVDLHVVANTGMLVPIVLEPHHGSRANGPSKVPPLAVLVESRCGRRAYRPWVDVVQSAAALRWAWLRIEEGVLRSPTVRALSNAFRSCITALGAPTAAGSSLESFVSWLYQEVNRRPTLQPKSASASKAVDLRTKVDMHWSQVFASCAGPLVTEVQRLLAIRQREFIAARNRLLIRLVTKVGAVISARS
jgi:hypothetical protein